MFEWIKDDKSLNRVIEEILNTQNNKKSSGISGYLTNGYYKRSYFDSTAVISAIQFMLNSSLTYEELEKKINNERLNEY